MYVIIDVEVESGSLHRLGWSSDGHLLCVAATKGEVFMYLTRLLGDTCRLYCVFLTSLLEVTVVDLADPANTDIQRGHGTNVHRTGTAPLRCGYEKPSVDLKSE